MLKNWELIQALKNAEKIWEFVGALKNATKFGVNPSSVLKKWSKLARSLNMTCFKSGKLLR
jgi:hypothetical protein